MMSKLEEPGMTDELIGFLAGGPGGWNEETKLHPDCKKAVTVCLGMLSVVCW
jgi:hypothetical protein